MLHKMHKLLEKKKAHSDELSDAEKNAKMNVIQSMRDMASHMMGDKLKGLKKVAIASDSEEGLEHGLDKAKELLHQHDEEGSPEMHESNEDLEHSIGDESSQAEKMDHSDDQEDEPSELQAHENDESEDHEASESPEQEAAEEHEDLDEDEINKRLEHLMKLKEKKKKKA